MIDYVDHISILKFSRSTPVSKYEVLCILFDDGDYVDIIIIMTAQSVCLCSNKRRQRTDKTTCAMLSLYDINNIEWYFVSMHCTCCLVIRALKRTRRHISKTK